VIFYRQVYFWDHLATRLQIHPVMKEFTQSFLSYSLAMGFFCLKQIDNVMNSEWRNGEEGNGDKAPAIKSLDMLTCATTAQFGETLADVFQAADRVQRGLVGWMFETVFPYAASAIRRQAPGNPEVILIAAPVPAPEI
jgi:hypothetical protein